MPLDNPRGGIGYSAEFQSSALPWITSSVAPTGSSPVRYDFPKVTRFLCFENLGANSLMIGFTRNGMTLSNNFFTLPASSSITLELRVKSVFVGYNNGPTSFSLCAGLTNIDAKMMPLLSGTVSGSVGWDGVG